MFSVRVIKAPVWWESGIDLKPRIAVALDRMGEEIERRKGRGLGARRNQLNRERHELGQRILSTRRWPRTTGFAWRANARARFRGMAPRIAKKYIFEPAADEWRKSRAGA